MIPVDGVIQGTTLSIRCQIRQANVPFDPTTVVLSHVWLNGADVIGSAPFPGNVNFVRLSVGLWELKVDTTPLAAGEYLCDITATRAGDTVVRQDSFVVITPNTP